MSKKMWYNKFIYSHHGELSHQTDTPIDASYNIEQVHMLDLKTDRIRVNSNMTNSNPT